jgi:hypothetical protein
MYGNIIVDYICVIFMRQRYPKCNPSILIQLLKLMIADPVLRTCTNRKLFPVTVSFCCILFAVFTQCAKVGSPTGGPKDEKPPEVTESKPLNKEKNWLSEEIEITFDEFIALKNLNDELIISPPLKEKPITRMRNKTLVIDLNEKLRDSTTYTLNFGNAIADNNEGNVLPDYELVFSTGPGMDSLSLTGVAVNAFNLSPEKEKVAVMLFDNLCDSAPYKELPLYFSRTSPEGKFAINNIRPDTFRLFALKDVNNNLKFDVPDEMIAYSDTTIIISPGRVRKINFVKDSSLFKPKSKTPGKKTEVPSDSVAHDTLKKAGRELYAITTSLFLFTEEDMRQNIMSKEREQRELLTFAFSRPLFDSIRIIPLDFTADRWYLQDISMNKDTVRFWITDTTLIKRDTLSLAVVYTTIDSVKNFTTKTDTVMLRFREKAAKSAMGRKMKDKEPGEDKNFLPLAVNLRPRSVIDLNLALRFTSPRPVDSFDIGKFSLTRFEDSLQFPQKIVLIKEPSALYSVRFAVAWMENTSYKLFVEPGAVSDIYGKTNDTVEIAFQTQKSDYYGKIILSPESRAFPLIIQLLDEKETKISEKYLNENGSVTFDYLAPKKYRLKAIADVNKNKKWDSGNYLGRVQPEKVHYYPGALDVRSNWDLDITWNLDETAGIR